MASAKRKRCTLSTGLKLEILEALKSKKAEDVAKEFNIGYSTVKKLRRREEGPKNIALRNGNLKRRRKRGSTDDVSDALIDWFHEMKAKNALINGPLMLEKAKQLAITLGHKDFEPSHSWLERFKLRNKIKFNKVSGEPTIKDEDGVDSSIEKDYSSTATVASEETTSESLEQSGNNIEVRYVPVENESDATNHHEIIIAMAIPTLIQQQDEYDVFANCIATQIRNLKSDYLRSKMKTKIQQVMQEIKAEEEEEEEEEENNLNNT